MAVPVDLIPLLNRALDVDTGVVDQKVEIAKPFDRAANRLLAARDGRNIAHRATEPVAATHSIHRPAHITAVQIVERNSRAARVELGRDRKPETPCGPGDQHSFAGKIIFHECFLDDLDVGASLESFHHAPHVIG